MPIQKLLKLLQSLQSVTCSLPRSKGAVSALRVERLSYSVASWLLSHRQYIASDGIYLFCTSQSY